MKILSRNMHNEETELSDKTEHEHREKITAQMGQMRIVSRVSFEQHRHCADRESSCFHL
jgi:hypothetical protein